MIIHTHSKLHTDVRNVKQDYLVCFVCSVEFVYEHKYTVYTVCAQLMNSTLTELNWINTELT